jgi:uncharacterized iron-regulated protein
VTGAARASALLLATLLLAAMLSPAAAAPADDTCARAGAWIAPATGERLAADQITAQLARRPAVLLGETHDNADHHRWQLHTVAQIYGRRADIVLGFEALPRRVQAAADAWVAGRLDADSFLDAVDWWRTWGYDAALYLPLLHFARLHRIPVRALNVDRDLVSRVARDGWAAVPAGEREGISDPAPPSPAYRQWLARVYAENHDRGAEGHDAGASGKPGDAAAFDPQFERFVEAQITWDRAMAEAITAAANGDGAADHARPEGTRPLVVAIVGRGHVEHRWGVPHQLDALGVAGSAVLVPVGTGDACRTMTADLADAVFLLADGDEAPAAPKLGIALSPAEGGVRVAGVAAGSIAAAAGLQVGDLILSAAGRPVPAPAFLAALARRQPPGTWLPLVVRRGDASLDIVARFPPAARPD